MASNNPDESPLSCAESRTCPQSDTRPSELSSSSLTEPGRSTACTPDEEFGVEYEEEGNVSQGEIYLALAIGILLRFVCRQYVYNDLWSLDRAAGQYLGTSHYHLIDVASYRTWQDSSLIECFVRQRLTDTSSRSFCPDVSVDYALHVLSNIFGVFTTLEVFLASLFVQLCTYRLIYLIYRKASSVSLNIFWYWLCPIFAFSCACSLSQSLFHLALAALVYAVCNEWMLASTVTICVLCTIDYKFLTLVPITFLASRRSTVTLSVVAAVGVISCLLYADANFIEKVTHKRTVLLDNFYIPSIGVAWYANGQVFDRYASYFASLWHLQPFVHAVPLCIRLKEHPAEAVLLQMSIILFFRSEVSGGDVAFMTALFFAFWSTVARVRWIVPIAVTIYGPILITPLLLHLWIDVGSGNANYIFFQGFGMSLAVAMFISGFANATLKRRPRDVLYAKNQGVSRAEKLD